jgi:hypothetical protein
MLQALTQERTVARQALVAAAKLARSRALQGIDIEVLIGAYHLTDQALWQALVAAAGAETSLLLPRAASLMFASLHAVSTVMSAAHAGAVRQSGRRGPGARTCHRPRSGWRLRRRSYRLDGWGTLTGWHPRTFEGLSRSLLAIGSAAATRDEGSRGWKSLGQSGDRGVRALSLQHGQEFSEVGRVVLVRVSEQVPCEESGDLCVRADLLELAQQVLDLARGGQVGVHGGIAGEQDRHFVRVGEVGTRDKIFSQQIIRPGDIR